MSDEVKDQAVSGAVSAESGALPPERDVPDAGPKATRQVVPYPQGSMDCRIGVDALEQVGRAAKTICGRPRLAALVSVGEPDAAYAPEVRRQLASVGFEVREVGLEDGSARVSAAARLYDALDAAGVTGDDLMVAIGDAELVSLAAFCAGTWCGGTPLVAVPTTFEACVCAVTPRALATGASAEMVSFGFWPRALFADVRTLIARATLSDLSRFRAVVVSTAMADSEAAVGRVVGEAEALAANDEEVVAAELYATLRARGKIATSTAVALRQATRYGQTFAEALAAQPGVGLAPADLLGEGLRFEGRVSAGLENLDVDTVLAQDDLLDLLGVEERPFSVEPASLLAAIKAASFKRRNRFQFALPLAPGRVRLTTVDDDMLEEHVEAWCASREG